MLSRTMNNQELLDSIEKQCRNVFRFPLWVLLRVLPSVLLWPLVWPSKETKKKGPSDSPDGPACPP